MVNTTGITIARALIAARTDIGLYQRYFLSPVSLTAGAEAARAQGQKRPAPASSSSSHRPADGVDQANVSFHNNRGTKGQSKGNKRSKQGGKGGGKGPASQPRPGGKGTSNKGIRGMLTSLTPDNKRKCFAFQRGKCSLDRCAFLHACTLCNGPHGLHECPDKKRYQGDASGGSGRTR